MPNYGFQSKQTAIKLKNMVQAGSANARSIPDSPFDDQGGIAFVNKTGKEIPPFALLFFLRPGANGTGSADYPAVGAYTYNQAKNDPGWSTFVKDQWMFNGSSPVETDDYGWAQAKDIVVYGFDKSGGGVADGTKFRPSQYYDFRVEQGSGDPEWVAYQTVSATELGATEDDRAIKLVVPYGGGGGTNTTIAAAKATETQGLYEITRVDEANPAGASIGDIVRVSLAFNYPVPVNAKAFIMHWGSGINIGSTGGGLGGGNTIAEWTVISHQVLECENPDSGTGPGPVPG